MRYIALRNQKPCDEWLAKANALIEEMKRAPDDASRYALVAANTQLWGELKDWLLELSHGKCWFSEAKDCFSHWDVEHYRPKRNAKNKDGTVDQGYWWLAFAWENLRICGNVGNRKKGTVFPLRTGCVRASPFGDLRYEQPELLDPADPDDPGLLFFNLQGEAIAAPHIADDWEKSRVAYSIERYKLDYPPLVDRRKLLWSECWVRLQEYLNELASFHADPTNMIARDRFKQAAANVRDLMREERELSAVARACVESSGDPRVLGLLRSA